MSGLGELGGLYGFQEAGNAIKFGNQNAQGVGSNGNFR